MLLQQVEHFKTKAMVIFSTIAVSVIALSQIGSYFINAKIPIGETVVVNSLLFFTHVRNFGGVFGSFQGKGWIFAIFTVVILLGVIWHLWRSNSHFYEYICYGFIVGGGGSNIIDRLVYGSVIDFISVQHIPYWNYIFNTADTMIHVGVWSLVVMTLYHSHVSKKEMAQESEPSAVTE